MPAIRPRRLKTLFGAGNVVAAANDADPAAGARRAAELARKAEAEKITGLFTADLLQIDPAGLAGPVQEHLLLNGLLPELRRRALIDTDYVGDDFRSNLELPPLTGATELSSKVRRA